MEVSDLIEAFDRRLDEEITVQEQHLIKGGPDTYDDYTGCVGLTGGMKRAKAVLHDIVNEWIRKEMGGDEDD